MERNNSSHVWSCAVSRNTLGASPEPKIDTLFATTLAITPPVDPSPLAESDVWGDVWAALGTFVGYFALGLLVGLCPPLAALAIWQRGLRS